MEDHALKHVRQFIHNTNLSRRRKRFKLNNWHRTSCSYLSNVLNIYDESLFEKKGVKICFSFLHKPDCPFTETCTCDVENSEIQVYFLSQLLMDMIKSSHSQIYFSEGHSIETVGDIENFLQVITTKIDMIGCDSSDDIDRSSYRSSDMEFDDEKRPDYKNDKDEFDSILCNLLKTAFTNTESLPCFIFSGMKIGPKMPFSELIAWLESE